MQGVTSRNDSYCLNHTVLATRRTSCRTSPSTRLRASGLLDVRPLRRASGLLRIFRACDTLQHLCFPNRGGVPTFGLTEHSGLLAELLLRRASGFFPYRTRVCSTTHTHTPVGFLGTHAFSELASRVDIQSKTAVGALHSRRGTHTSPCTVPCHT